MHSTAIALEYGQLNQGFSHSYKSPSLEALVSFIRERCLMPKENTLPKEPSQVRGTSSMAECISLGSVGFLDWVDDAISELNEIYNEVAEEDWDGYGAAAIPNEAYIEANKILMNVPTFLPKPEITAESDGAIGLEWFKYKGYTFILSVNGNKTIFYAGLFGSRGEVHGKESFSGFLPKAIIDGLKRLYLGSYESE